MDDSTRRLDECRAALRSMALYLSRAEDEERYRIARGLHDDLGQTLSAMQLRLAELQRAGTDEAGRSSILESIGDLVDQAIKSSRSLTFELMAPLLPDVGIHSEVERFATRLTETHGIPCSFEADDLPKPLSSTVAVALLRVTRELLVNVAKHSQARTAGVTLTRDGDRVRLTVSDDGIGYDPACETRPEQAGVGLLIIRERLAEVGGEIQIESGRNSGTRTVVTAPLEVEGGGVV